MDRLALVLRAGSLAVDGGRGGSASATVAGGVVVGSGVRGDGASSHAHPSPGAKGEPTSWEAPGRPSGLRSGPLSWILTPAGLPRSVSAKVS